MNAISTQLVNAGMGLFTSSFIPLFCTIISRAQLEITSPKRISAHNLFEISILSFVFFADWILQASRIPSFSTHFVISGFLADIAIRPKKTFVGAVTPFLYIGESQGEFPRTKARVTLLFLVNLSLSHIGGVNG